MHSLKNQAKLQPGLKTPGLKFKIDQANSRIWVNWLGSNDISGMVDFIISLAKRYSLEKIIVFSSHTKGRRLVNRGFSLEGKLDKFFQGQPAYFFTYYLSQRRKESSCVKEREEILREIGKDKGGKRLFLPEGYQVETASIGDAAEMAEVFRRVFTTYPTSITDPAYLAKVMTKNVFKKICYSGRIVSIAAAEIDYENNNAELTNCATLPDHRGKGLMNILISELEKDCKKIGLSCLYSLARARSFGMNRSLYQNGYKYQGTLVNNCHICGGYEDMNIWEKV